MNPDDQLTELDSVPLWRLADAPAVANDEHARDLQAKIHAWDQKIVEHLRDDVSPPPELKSQILSAVTRASEDSELSDERSSLISGSSEIGGIDMSDTPVATIDQQKRSPSRHLVNRWTMGVAAAVCLGLIALGLSFIFNQDHDPLRVMDIIHEVEASVSQDPVFLEVARQGKPPEGMGVPTQYLAEDSKGFRIPGELFGSHVVAHDLRLGSPVVRLFVIRTDEEIQPDLVIGGPPHNPQSDTNGRCIGAWHSKDRRLVYVLMVHGDKNDYRRLVRHRVAA